MKRTVFCAVPAATLALLAAVATPAFGESLDEAAARLRYDYRQQFAGQSPGELPFTVAASREEGMIRSRALVTLDGVDFDRLTGVLGSLEGWCDSLLLHLNVKTCVYSEGADPRLELYLGRKHYEHPSESQRIVFRFDVEDRDGATRATLTAEDGPFGTSDYLFVATAIEVPSGAFLELRLSNREGLAGGLIDLYFTTLGRSKVGFTRVGETLFGNPEYVRGQVGAAERNVVRYLYALRVTLELGGAPFRERTRAWFDATERHPRQLGELERDSYLSIKEREYQNQVYYQHAADRGETVVVEERQKRR